MPCFREIAEIVGNPDVAELGRTFPILTGIPGNGKCATVLFRGNALKNF